MLIRLSIPPTNSMMRVTRELFLEPFSSRSFCSSSCGDNFSFNGEFLPSHVALFEFPIPQVVCGFHDDLQTKGERNFIPNKFKSTRTHNKFRFIRIISGNKLWKTTYLVRLKLYIYTDDICESIGKYLNVSLPNQRPHSTCRSFDGAIPGAPTIFLFIIHHLLSWSCSLHCRFLLRFALLAPTHAIRIHLSMISSSKLHSPRNYENNSNHTSTLNRHLTHSRISIVLVLVIITWPVSTWRDH